MWFVSPAVEEQVVGRLGDSDEEGGKRRNLMVAFPICLARGAWFALKMMFSRSVEALPSRP